MTVLRIVFSALACWRCAESADLARAMAWRSHFQCLAWSTSAEMQVSVRVTHCLTAACHYVPNWQLDATELAVLPSASLWSFAFCGPSGRRRARCGSLLILATTGLSAALELSVLY